MGECVRTVKSKNAAVGDIALDTASRPAIADLQGTRADRRAAGMAVCASQTQGAGAALLQASSAADDAAKGSRVRAIEDKRAIVGNIAYNGAG